ncbi:hypothetical protein [Flavobacterium sp. 140616W15]|uniref:hypothetical protein n=1 Tax=Flavobacterium sp. 140616W15 TaxID=2478552 RepID=UPI000F0CB4B4|nr:hypothetical protein [Flavobacterium sp. 140616W15]AYN02762.1 hypothetical protein EAG11_00165 [Flavobacterium sp. 140616W15]
MKYQESFLKAIRSKVSKSISLIDEVASVLEISYDASHRRISEKSKFSIDETIKLADHFNISLDNLFSKKKKLLSRKQLK